jgi:hypothetical protein
MSACFYQVLSNPFDDIIPRDIRHNKVEMPEKPVKQSKSKGTKNFSLLSFGEEAEEDEQQVNTIATKIKSSHDLLTKDPKLSSKPAVQQHEYVCRCPPIFTGAIVSVVVTMLYNSIPTCISLHDVGCCGGVSMSSRCDFVLISVD